MLDELKEGNISNLILIVRFACATLDVGHPINWDGVIPDEDKAFLYRSLNAQTYFFKQHYSRFAQVRTRAAIFHMSHTSYYLMSPAGARVIEPPVLSAAPPRLGPPHLVPPELE
jgi:hypothetical protein